MKLQEMSTKTAKKLNKLMESRFGFTINYDNLDVTKATKLNEKITANLDNIRHSVDLHTAEKNPRYMELLTVQEGLSTWLKENSETEVITEGEVGSAEVLLAAKSMVDEVQDMIETAGKMQNEQLPQLLDSIRDQLGSEQADAFQQSVGGTLEQLMPALQTARDGVDGGVRVLSGEQVDTPMDMPTPDSDLDLEVDDVETVTPDADGFDATGAAVGGDTELGRELR
jgi:uncharacterized protein YicC (UPF0701 family)|tara:strand:- start:1691 stop:2368 length:678 start_codon:yes stop_codon:yes gene_type:complete